LTNLILDARSWAIRAVVAIAPALWWSTQMGEPLTWDKIPNLDNDSG